MNKQRCLVQSPQQRRLALCSVSTPLREKSLAPADPAPGDAVPYSALTIGKDKHVDIGS